MLPPSLLVLVWVCITMFVVLAFASRRAAITRRVTTVAGGSGKRPPGGGNVTPVSPPGATYFDSDLREADVAALDTWTPIGVAIKVPTQANFLVGLDIVTAWDFGGAVGVRGLSALRLTGNGLRDGGMYRFAAHAGSQTLVTQGGAGFDVPVMHYPLAIPVVGANEILIEGIMLGEDCGEFTMVVSAQWSDKPIPGGFIDGDFREADIAAVDTETGLVNIGALAAGNPVVPIDKNELAAMVALIALDAGAGAVTVRLAGGARIGGNGLKLGGSYRFPVPGGWIAVVTEGGAAFCTRPEIKAVGLPLVPGNTLELFATLFGEDPGDVTALVGVLYQ